MNSQDLPNNTERHPEGMEVLNIGTVLKVNEEGFIVSESNLEKIKPPWLEAADDVVFSYIENLGDAKVHSIYIKGSVSRGTPLEGVSDMDAIAVVNTSSDNMDLEWVSQEQQKLQAKYPFCTGFDLSTVPYEEIISGKRPIASCLLKVSSACIYGDDLAKKLPDVKPGPDCFICLRNINNYVDKKIELMQEENTKMNPANQSKWVMKYLLRAAFELTMEREQVFTRDLYPSYEHFTNQYPEKEKEAKRVLEAAVKRDASREEILDILQNFGRWVVAEKEKLYPQR